MFGWVNISTYPRNLHSGYVNLETYYSRLYSIFYYFGHFWKPIILVDHVVSLVVSRMECFVDVFSVYDLEYCCCRDTIQIPNGFAFWLNVLSHEKIIFYR